MGNRLDWAILRPAIGSRPEFVFFPYFFFSLLCVCVSYSLANDEVRKEKERAGKRRGSSFCFFFVYYLFTRLFMIPPSGGFRHHLDAAAAVVIPRKGDSGSVLKSFSGFMSGLTWLYQALPLFLSLFGF